MNSIPILNLFPYTGKKGQHLIRSLRKDMHHTLPGNVQARICYTGNKLGTKFNNIKDPTNMIYSIMLYPKPGC